MISLIYASFFSEAFLVLGEPPGPGRAVFISGCARSYCLEEADISAVVAL